MTRIYDSQLSWLAGIAVAVALLLHPIVPAEAQVTKGVFPFGSFANSPIDTVDLANLNVHMEIPIVQKKGRGLDFDYRLMYDSSIWAPVTVNGSLVWAGPGSSAANNNFWGWYGASNDWPGSLTNSPSQGKCSWYQGPPPVPPIQHTNYWTYYSNWQYTDGYGATHVFSGSTTQINSTDGHCGPTQTTTLDAVAIDGSGWSLHAVGSSGGVTSRSGVHIDISGETATDRNGNRLTLSASNTTYTDTLNTTALTIYAGSSPPSPVQYIWSNPSGSTSQATLNFTLTTINTLFHCPGIAEYNSSVYIPTSLSLPDGTSYQFSYDNNGYVHTVTLPTGGPVTYWFYNVNCADGSTLQVFRDPNNNQPSGVIHWTYTRAQVSGSEWTTTVEPPVSPTVTPPDTVITFQGNYETLRQVYSGTVHSDAYLLRTMETCYNGATTNCSGTTVTSPITQRTITTHLEGAANTPRHPSE